MFSMIYGYDNGKIYQRSLCCPTFFGTKENVPQFFYKEYGYISICYTACLTTSLCVDTIFNTCTVIDTQPPVFEGPTREVVFAQERNTAAKVDYSWEPVKVSAFN